MNIEPKHIDALHQQIQLILPWYLSRNLQPDEHVLVANHIRYCLICHRELNVLKKIASAISVNPDLEMAANASFVRLSRQFQIRAPLAYKTNGISSLKIFRNQINSD